MTATYDLTRDFDSGDELTQQTPFWVVGIVRFANQATYAPRRHRSVSSSDNFAMQERGDPLVLTSEVKQMRVSCAKDAHVSNMAFTVAPGSFNMLTEVMTGDWVVGCMLNSETQGKKVAQKMRDRQPINGWADGFKFLGKVTSCRKAISASVDGTLKTVFNIQTVGFAEFDSLLFYNAQLTQQNSIPVTMQQFGTFINKIVDKSSSSIKNGAVDINKVLPELIRVIFGTGAWAAAPTIKTQAAGTVRGGANSSYLIPTTIFKWMGLDPSRVKTYKDLIYVLIGIQHYKTVANASANADAWNLFQPDGVSADSSGDVLHISGHPLIGFFPVSAPPMQASVWDMLSGYMNEPLNEMFVALKPDADGDVFPHLVIRQTPYTSSAVSGVADVTDFMELPRWKLPSTAGRNLIISADIGRADAGRTNMVHVSGAGIGSIPVGDVGWFVKSPPVMDLADIKRHGVRPYMPGINCVLVDPDKGPLVWRDIMADVVMGQQLRLNGQFVIVGVQSPIAPGDNLEFDGLVFHIESVAHAASIDDSGKRVFRTVLQVTHGVNDETTQAADISAGETHRQALFAGVRPADDTLQNQSSSTVDGE